MSSPSESTASSRNTPAESTVSSRNTPAESTVSSRNTPTESTFASESTDIPDPLLNKVFLAGCRKNFVGKGPSMFSKAEIKELNIPDLADLVTRKATSKHSQVKKSVIHHLGLCRIYQKAVAYLEEDVQKLYQDVNSVLYNEDNKDKKVASEANKSQKSKKKRDEQKEDRNDIDAASITSNHLADHDFAAIFPRNLQTDKHLINELDDRLRAPLEDTYEQGFGDEEHLQNEFSLDRIDRQINPLGSEPLAPDVSSENGGTTVVVQAMVHQSEGTQSGRASSPKRGDGGDPAGDNRSAKSTPKRKTSGDHDETPTKRQRRKSPPGPPGIKGSVSRKLFGPDTPSSPTHDDGIMRRNTDEDEVEPFTEQIPPPPAPQEGTRRSSIQINVDPPSVQDAQGDHESEQPPAVDVPSPRAQPPPEASLGDSNDTELEELPEEALTPKRRKKAKPFVDETTRIPRIDITNLEEYTHVHTRTLESTRINFEKLSLKNLFSMPSMKMKANGPCTWPEELQNLYIENAHPIAQPGHEGTSRASSTPRDINVDKRPRLSSFRRNARSGSTEPPMPHEQEIPPGGIEEDPPDPDRELMPPPSEPPMLSRPSDEQATPRTPGRSRGEQSRHPSLTSSPQQRSPRTPGDGQPHTSSISPRQAPLIQITPDPAEAEQSGGAAIPNISAQMSPTPSARERSTLMDEREFYRFLEEKWVGSFIHEVELDELIEPRRSTLTKFHRYFTYLQSFQAKKKLSMEQETIYGPVHILKTIQEQEE